MQVGKDKGPPRIQLSGRDRIAMLILFVLQIIFALSYLFVFNHYVFMPVPNLISAPSLVASPYTKPAYLYNAAIYALFFVQHIVMALLIFKIKVSKIWAKFPLYQRYIYNVTSGIALILIYYNAKPLSGESQIVFTTPLWINVPLLLVFVPLQFYTLYKFFTIVFVPYPIKQILTSKSVQPEDYNLSATTGLVTTGLYGWCRHPMQSAVFGAVLFVSNVYTVDRLVLLAVNLVGVLLGIWYQEKRLVTKFQGYKDYMKKVPYRLIPFVF